MQAPHHANPLTGALVDHGIVRPHPQVTSQHPTREDVLREIQMVHTQPTAHPTTLLGALADHGIMHQQPHTMQHLATIPAGWKSAQSPYYTDAQLNSEVDYYKAKYGLQNLLATGPCRGGMPGNCYHVFLL